MDSKPGPRQHPLAKALLEYGKLLRTLHALRWFTDEAFRRRIARQFNLGEVTTDVRQFIFYANRGAVRYPTTTTKPPRPSATPSPSTPASCPPPATSKTPIEAQRTDGHPVSDEAIAGLSPARFRPSTRTEP